MHKHTHSRQVCIKFTLSLAYQFPLSTQPMTITVHDVLGIVVTTSPTCSLYRIVVFPAPSSPLKYGQYKRGMTNINYVQYEDTELFLSPETSKQRRENPACTMSTCIQGALAHLPMTSRKSVSKCVSKRESEAARRFYSLTIHM